MQPVWSTGRVIDPITGPLPDSNRTRGQGERGWPGCSPAGELQPVTAVDVHLLQRREPRSYEEAPSAVLRRAGRMRSRQAVACCRARAHPTKHMAQLHCPLTVASKLVHVAWFA